MNLRAFDYLVAVHKLNSFRAAAEHCYVSQPALSIALKKLEDELGSPLMERSNKGVIFTAVGQEVVKRAESILRQVRELEQLADSWGDPFSGPFSLGAFPTLGPYYFPSTLQVFRDKFPKLQFNLVEEKTDKLIDQLKEGVLDAALIALPINDPELDYAELFEEPFFVGVNNDHAFAKKKTIHTDELAEERLLLLDEGHCLRGQAMDYCLSSGLNEDVGFRASSMPTLLQMIAMGQAVSFIPQCVANQNPHLHYLKLRGASVSRTIALVWRHNTVRPQVMVELAKQLKAVATKK